MPIQPNEGLALLVIVKKIEAKIAEIQVELDKIKKEIAD